MKILYVKNNSERAKEFQLRTTVYEEDNGEKFVTKKALYPEAIPHLKRMKESYTKLTQAIINPKIKLAKIIAETDDSLTFEFIQGESLEKRYNDIKKISASKAEILIDDYFELLKTGFKTTVFDSDTMLTDTHKILFGDIDYKQFDGKLCFEGISNIDLIFSNILFFEESIYLIDYEWVFDINIFVDYAAYRALHHDHDQWYGIEEHFLEEYVVKANGFHKIQHNYLQSRPDIVHQIQSQREHIKELVAHVDGKEEHIQELALRIHNLGEDLEYAREIISLRDQQIQDLRIKNRIKRLIKKIIPWKKTDLNLEDKATSSVKVYRYNTPRFSEEIQKKLNVFHTKPLISIIMPVYNVDIKWLDLAINSIENQWYENWELCIADDKSTNQETLDYLENIRNPKIKVKFLNENLNISGASNAALSLAQGEYIALMDNDDEITPDALYEIVKTINETEADFIYSDEDFISPQEQYINPHFKPDFSPDLLLSHNYITHLSCFKRALLKKVGHFNSAYDGAQDYELFLRLTERAERIVHIPKVLYHWRMLESSTSLNSEAKPEALARGKNLLIETLERRGIEGSVEYGNMNHYFRVRYNIKNNPLVSIIIPFKDKPELLEMSINSVLDRSTYVNYEIIGISNNSEEAETFETMAKLEKKDPRVKFYEYNVPFNYAQINNYAVENYAKGEHILLLNNDIEVIEPEWIEAMLEHSQREEIGCVGAKLYYPNDTIQHAGIIIGLGGYAGHSHKMYPRDNPGYFNRLNVIQNVSAVTAACLMIKKSIYQEVNGMDEVSFKVAYNDVDFCLRVLEKGYRNLFTPYAELYHHESVSRGYETTPEKIARFGKEKDALKARHSNILKNGDPCYNPNLTQDREDFSIR